MKNKTKKYTRDNEEIPHFQSICPTALRSLAEICTEGDNRYGEFNWCKVTPEESYKLKKDAIQHIDNHFNLYRSGDRTENHLAKVMWGCMAMIHHDKNCSHQTDFIKKEN